MTPQQEQPPRTDLTSIFRDADSLRAYFMERGWSIEMDDNGRSVIDPFAAIIESVRAATPSPSSGLDAAWAAVEAVLPKSKGRWGYSIGGLTYGTRGWCAVAQGERSEEHAEAYGATPADALRSLAVRLQEQER